MNDLSEVGSFCVCEALSMSAVLLARDGTVIDFSAPECQDVQTGVGWVISALSSILFP